jgi:hypothetical protein
MKDVPTVQSERLTRCPVNENVQKETTYLPSTQQVKEVKNELFA